MSMRNEAYFLTEVDRSILHALARFHYLTAAQANRLLYPNNKADNNRYMQDLFKRLVDSGYVLRLRALPKKRYGQPPHVFTLAGKGREYLRAEGVVVEGRCRPSEQRRASENTPFMTHRLATIDVMIAADRLCRMTSVICPQMLSERELKRTAVKVDVPPTANSLAEGTRRVAVIPDAWMQLSPGIGRLPYSIAVELDRATEDQTVWRQKVAAYVMWVQGPYKTVFDTDNVTIAVVCPDEQRQAILIDWTMRELRARKAEVFGQLFLVTAMSPVTTPPRRFFFGNGWRVADTGESARLLPFGEPGPTKEGVVFQIV